MTDEQKQIEEDIKQFLVKLRKYKELNSYTLAYIEIKVQIITGRAYTLGMAEGIEEASDFFLSKTQKAPRSKN